MLFSRFKEEKSTTAIEIPPGGTFYTRDGVPCMMVHSGTSHLEVTHPNCLMFVNLKTGIILTITKDCLVWPVDFEATEVEK